MHLNWGKNGFNSKFMNFFIAIYFDVQMICEMMKMWMITFFNLESFLISGDGAGVAETILHDPGHRN